MRSNNFGISVNCKKQIFIHFFKIQIIKIVYCCSGRKVQHKFLHIKK